MAVNDGTVYVYDLISAPPRSVAIPSLVATLNNPNTAADDGFGSSVAISGTRVVVGDTSSVGFGTGPTEPPLEAGSVYVYDLASATPTEPETTLDNPARWGSTQIISPPLWPSRARVWWLAPISMKLIKPGGTGRGAPMFMTYQRHADRACDHTQQSQSNRA